VTKMVRAEESDNFSCRGFDLVLKELVSLHGDVDGKNNAQRPGFDRVLRELFSEREKVTMAAEQVKQSELLMAEREKAAVATALLKQKDETARLLANQQNDHLTRQDQLIARQERERQEERRVVLEQQARQQIFFREVIQQLQEEVKVLRHSVSGKSRVCQGRVILKQPDDANRFRSSFDSIHSWRS